MPATGFWHWLPVMTVTICWGLFGLVWLAGAIYNSGRAPAVREHDVDAVRRDQGRSRAAY
jgi:hypothetical protein